MTAVAGVVGGAGLIFAAVPFVASLQPGARARAEGGPVRVNTGKMQPGMQITVRWRGKPVWVFKRGASMLRRLDSPDLRARLRDPDSAVESQQPAYVSRAYRSIRPEILVAIGLCTHLSCVPTYRPEDGPAGLGADWPGGYFCPCHGSRFDLAGRVFKGVPAPTNLMIPPHRYLGGNQVEIGVHSDGRPAV